MPGALASFNYMTLLTLQSNEAGPCCFKLSPPSISTEQAVRINPASKLQCEPATQKGHTAGWVGRNAQMGLLLCQSPPGCQRPVPNQDTSFSSDRSPSLFQEEVTLVKGLTVLTNGPAPLPGRTGDHEKWAKWKGLQTAQRQVGWKAMR